MGIMIKLSLLVLVTVAVCGAAAWFAAQVYRRCFLGVFRLHMRALHRVAVVEREALEMWDSLVEADRLLSEKLGIASGLSGEEALQQLEEQRIVDSDGACLLFDPYEEDYYEIGEYEYEEDVDPRETEFDALDRQEEITLDAMEEVSGDDCEDEQERMEFAGDLMAIDDARQELIGSSDDESEVPDEAHDWHSEEDESGHGYEDVESATSDLSPLADLAAALDECELELGPLDDVDPAMPCSPIEEMFAIRRALEHGVAKKSMIALVLRAAAREMQVEELSETISNATACDVSEVAPAASHGRFFVREFIGRRGWRAAQVRAAASFGRATWRALEDETQEADDALHAQAQDRLRKMRTRWRKRLVEHVVQVASCWSANKAEQQLATDLAVQRFDLWTTDTSEPILRGDALEEACNANVQALGEASVRLVLRLPPIVDDSLPASLKTLPAEVGRAIASLASAARLLERRQRLEVRRGRRRQYLEARRTGGSHAGAIEIVLARDAERLVDAELKAQRWIADWGASRTARLRRLEERISGGESAEALLQGFVPPSDFAAWDRLWGRVGNGSKIKS